MSIRPAVFSDFSDTLIPDDQVVELKADNRSNGTRTVIHMSTTEFNKTFKDKGTTRKIPGRAPALPVG